VYTVSAPYSPFPHLFPLPDIYFLCLFFENLFLFALFFWGGGTGAWTQGLHLEPFHQPFFVLGFLKIGSHKLFAWAGFELWSSLSLPSK
jgi:hypothetical protein